MATEKSSTKQASKGKALSHEQIIAGFNELRQQQRAVASKLSELDMERKEHELVVEALKDVAPERRCFRMVGGVLVERTVQDVLPALTANKEQIAKLIETLTHQLEVKGKEINEYRSKYNLHVRGEDEQKPSEKTEAKSSGVLVAGDS
ncbi:prefoldin subunit 2 [Lingula anatina]|uniref:Prefoldin subunit 2 n=1 Tax=Lingula anatina TaxID=7574 RepID=A0A1S3JWZ8_LINAN|nr:prefoldin subunit 2 [Lingula anatina]|eukprot:XP_013414903.1 prefoldin subunit 2 [Lingula anatina]